ncbi:MAG: hypothetical protein STSR0009_20610 [Methanoregula sp.]
MVYDIMMKGFVATYFASPQGQETIHSYLSSAEGQAMIKKYLTTPEGQRTAQLLLPHMLECLNLP